MDKEDVAFLDNEVLLVIRKGKLETFPAKWDQLDIIILSKVRPMCLHTTLFL